jgi:hypothetical protein
MTAPVFERPPRRSDRVVARACDDGMILLKLDDGRYYTLDEIAARIWELCDGTRASEDVAAALAEHYDAPSELIRADVEELIAELASEELLVGIA